MAKSIANLAAQASANKGEQEEMIFEFQLMILPWESWATQEYSKQSFYLVQYFTK